MVRRNVFFAIYLSMIAMLAGVFVFLPRRSERRIGFSMKIPNRDYWLAPERLQQIAPERLAPGHSFDAR